MSRRWHILATLGACFYLAGCQSTPEGSPDDPPAEEPADGETATAETPESELFPLEEPWPDPEAPDPTQPPEDSGVRVSVQGDDGEWETLTGEPTADVPWLDDAAADAATTPPETVAPFLTAPEPVVDDFERVPWEENPRQARWQSRRENKFLFFAFLSTELGAASTRLKRELFASRDFHAFARDRLVLTFLDYPRGFGTQPDEIKRQRYYRSFKEHFGVHGFPVIVVLDPQGNVITKIRGYGSRDSAATILAELEQALGPGAASVSQATSR